MNKFLILLLVLIVVAYFILSREPDTNPQELTGLPWQIDKLPQGQTRVFGLTLGQSTFADARASLGDMMELAIIGNADQVGLEMYYSRYNAGPLTGRLVLVADLSRQQIAQLRQRSVQKGPSKKYLLHPADMDAAYQSLIKSITFIPQVNLDEEIAIQRFGRPAEVIVANEQEKHLLYPDKGLDIMINRDGKEILQYVTPGRFAELLIPLRKFHSAN